MTKHNPVAKNAYKFNKSKVQEDKKKKDMKYWARQPRSSLDPLI